MKTVTKGDIQIANQAQQKIVFESNSEAFVFVTVHGKWCEKENKQIEHQQTKSKWIKKKKDATAAKRTDENARLPKQQYDNCVDVTRYFILFA